MKRVNYSTYPIPHVNTKELDGNVAAAEIFDDTLVLDLWSDGKYVARYCIDENGKYSASIESDWRQAKFQTLFGCDIWAWPESINLSFASKMSRTKAIDFLLAIDANDKYGYTGNSAERLIDRAETAYVRNQRDRAYDRKRARIRDLVMSAPPVPNDFNAWCLKTAFADKHYWFYDKDDDLYHCTACGGTHKNHTLKHNGETVCCRSGKPVTVKRRQNKIDAYEHVMLLQRIDDTKSVARHFKVAVEWSNEHITICRYENVQIYLPRLGLSKLIILYGQCVDADEYNQSWWDTSHANRRTRPCYCYPVGVRDALDGTRYSDIGIADMADAGWKLEYNMLMCSPEKARCYEYLLKGKFKRLAVESSSGFSPDGYYGKLNVSGTTDTEVLGLDKQRVNRLRQMNGGVNTMLWLRKEAADGRQIPTATLEWYDLNKVYPSDVTFIRDRMSPTQISNYTDRMMRQYNDSAKHILTQWADYLSMAKRLKMDVNDEVVYRTKDLCRRHDELVERINAASAKDAAKKMARKFPRVNRVCKTLTKYEWSGAEYAVIAPKGISDIMREGANLHHCVGTSDRYYERMQDGETFILFLRKNEAPDISYYTLEVEPDGTVRQKRAAFDRQPDIEQVRKFLTEWQKVIAQRLTEADRKAARKSQTARAENMKELKNTNTWLFNKLSADLMPA